MKQIAARGVTMVVRSATIVVLASMSAVVPVSAADEPVSLDVVVTDAKMRPLQDLKVSDFELTDAGEIRAVDAVRPQSGSPRVFGILLDEFHVMPARPRRAPHDALLRFVDAQLRQGDLVAIVKPLDPLHAITFTQDRTVIRQVIAAFEGHAGDYSPRSEFERNFMSRDPRTADPARAQVVSAALQALARRLGDQPASRRALIFVSEGFRPEQPRAITSAANRNHVRFIPSIRFRLRATMMPCCAPWPTKPAGARA
jgi:VWFA-related protein